MLRLANSTEFSNTVHQIEALALTMFTLRNQLQGHWKFYENCEDTTDDLMDLFAFESELTILLNFKIMTDCDVIEELTSHSHYHPYQVRLLHIRDQAKGYLYFLRHFLKHMDRIAGFGQKLIKGLAYFDQLKYFLMVKEQKTKKATEPKPSTSKKSPPAKQNEEDLRSHLGDIIVGLNHFMTTQPFLDRRRAQPPQGSDEGSDRSGTSSSEGKTKKRRKDHQPPPEVPMPEESPDPCADFNVRLTPEGCLKGKLPPYNLPNEETMQLTVEATDFTGDISSFGPTLDTVRDKLISLIPEHLEARTEDILSKNDPDYEFVLCRKDNRYFDLKDVFDDPSIPFNVTSRSFPIIKQDTRVIIETALGSLLIETRRDYILINRLK